MEFISSSQNPRIKRLVQLHRSRGRNKQQRIAVFGAREITRAIESGVQPDELFICEPLVEAAVVSRLRSFVSAFETVAYSVPEDLFEKVCFGDRSDGIVMTSARPDLEFDLFRQRIGTNPIIAVAESVEKPGNLGAILRSVDGAGIDGLILADPVTDWFHPNTIRASLGTCFSVPGATSKSADALNWLIENGYQVVVASLQNSKPFFDFDLTSKTAIVFGNEANGVSEAWNAEGCSCAKLPMKGIADSLNVSAAAAVMFYEARRQRG